ncbi:chemotaxis protein [Paenibacillus solani]|uniref:Chemotaxis protein n=1 Tax=Paenibacillus solani TaxID=1705565 RepID=A0A0M1P141_9BACL|nr:chemotaxis protein [Paenibacillus solani]
MRLTLSKKLFLGVLAVILILAVTVAISYTRITAVNTVYGNLIDDKARKLIMIQELAMAIKQEKLALRGYLILGNEESLQEISDSHDNYLKLSKNLGDIIVLPKAKELLSELNEIEEQFYQLAGEEAEFKKQGNTEAYINLVKGEGHKITEEFDQKTEEFTSYQQNILDKGHEDTLATVQSIKTWVLILGIFATLLGIAIAVYLGRLISKPIVTISEAAKKIASGDLTIPKLKVKNKDEIGELAASFNQMSGNLQDLIHQINLNAEQVAATAEELTASSEQTSLAAEQIAASMQEVATGVDNQFKTIGESSHSINEMSMGTREIAQNTKSASAAAVEAHEKAAEGAHAIQTVAEQMQSIQHTFGELDEEIRRLGNRSNEIGQIVEVIKEIAAQTNLLALNASIEAARAGEYGQGFAVVASEVHKLAEQSALSAQQVSTLINSIQSETSQTIHSMQVASKKVAAGIGVVNTAGQSFEHIQESVHAVTAQIQEVSSAVQQMSAGTEQMAHSMQYITEVSENTAAGTQEVAASAEEQQATMKEISIAAHSLSDMAEQHRTTLEKFTV